LFDIGPANFEERALALFRYQAVHCPVYAAYVAARRVVPARVNRLTDLPFLPIEFFKTHRVLSRPEIPTLVFQSSGTTGQTPSQHWVVDPAFYQQVAQRIFEQVYGPLGNFHLLALLPNYLERGGSSLVFMVEHFMQTTSPQSGFFLHNWGELEARLTHLPADGRRPLVIGVTFALLDWAASWARAGRGNLPPGTVLMETGGMKGRRREMVRAEVHQELQSAFGLAAIHSEYGMTELFSQAYAQADGWLTGPPWFKVLLRDLDDPLRVGQTTQNGGLNIIDLANADSCAFIETKDVGSLDETGQAFQVLGRYDNADVRGCNLMVS
jgi:hypothetical protein